MTEVAFAEWGTRLGAYLIDAVIAVMPLILTAILAGVASAMLIAVPFIVAAIAFSLLYKPLWEARDGQTIAKRWLDIKVVREDGLPMSAGPAFARWAVAFAVNAVPGGGIVNGLWPLWDDKNQALHDKAAKTLVVKV